MSELYIALLHVSGAFIYGAARADDVAGAVATLGEDRELLGIEWLQTYDSLPPRGQESEPVLAVLAALGEGAVALDWEHAYPDDEEPDPAEAFKERLEAFVEHWIDGAVERLGFFEVGDYAFVAELRLDDEVEIGWAYQGSLTGAADLFARAAEDARGGVDRGDG